MAVCSSLKCGGWRWRRIIFYCGPLSNTQSEIENRKDNRTISHIIRAARCSLLSSYTPLWHCVTLHLGFVATAVRYISIMGLWWNGGGGGGGAVLSANYLLCHKKDVIRQNPNLTETYKQYKWEWKVQLLQVERYKHNIGFRNRDR